jgi:hypothetical protein
VAKSSKSRTAPYLARFLKEHVRFKAAA